MAGRSLTFSELAARGVCLRELGDGPSADREAARRMLELMKREGITASAAYCRVLREDRDLAARRERAHGKPLSLCEEPSSSRSLSDFIRADAEVARRYPQFLGIGE
jgi:hypothetical protein